MIFTTCSFTSIREEEMRFHFETLEGSSSSDILLLEPSHSPGEEQNGTRQHSNRRSLVLALAKAFRSTLYRSLVFKLCSDLLAFSNPMILK